MRTLSCSTAYFKRLLCCNRTKMWYTQGMILSLNEVKKMKSGIHPNYEEVTIRCACGETVKTRSTKGDMRVEICSKCHPFFTGKQKFVDAGGRVDKFKQRLNKAK